MGQVVTPLLRTLTHTARKVVETCLRALALYHCLSSSVLRISSFAFTTPVLDANGGLH